MFKLMVKKIFTVLPNFFSYMYLDQLCEKNYTNNLYTRYIVTILQDFGTFHKQFSGNGSEFLPLGFQTVNEFFCPQP